MKTEDLIHGRIVKWIVQTGGPTAAAAKTGLTKQCVHHVSKMVSVPSLTTVLIFAKAMGVGLDSLAAPLSQGDRRKRPSRRRERPRTRVRAIQDIA